MKRSDQSISETSDRSLEGDVNKSKTSAYGGRRHFYAKKRGIFAKKRERNAGKTLLRGSGAREKRNSAIPRPRTAGESRTLDPTRTLFRPPRGAGNAGDALVKDRGSSKSHGVDFDDLRGKGIGRNSDEKRWGKNPLAKLRRRTEVGKSDRLRTDKGENHEERGYGGIGAIPPMLNSRSASD